MVPIQFPRDYTSDLLRKLVEARGVEGAQLEEIYLDNGESHENLEMLATIKGAIGSFQAIAFGGIGESAGRKAVLVSSNISRAYMRGIAKIAFHYYLAMSDVHTGAEFLFQPIRNFIQHGDGDSEDFVMLLAPHFVKALASGESPDVFCHLLAYYRFNGFLTAAVQLFVGPDHVPYPSLVNLGITKKIVPHRAHRVTYYGDKIDNHDGELREFAGVELVPMDAADAVASMEIQR